jgi:predicted permease
VVLSYRWWQQQFDRDPGVLGQSVSFNGSSFTVVGVLPREFHGVTPGAGMEFYISLSAAPQLMPDVISHAPSDPWFVWLMARLKPGVSDVQCQAALNVACARAMATSMKQPAVGLVDGRAGPDEARGLYRKSLLMLLGMVGVVLLVVCANLAGLMLARGAARQYEFAVRAALGAGRVRLVRQSLTESLLVALLGGGLGIVFAVWGKAAVLQLVVPRQLHYAPSLDLRVLGFTLAVTLVTALLSGLMPALRAAGVAPLARLNDKPAIGTLRLRAGHALVVGQIALSLLLVAAGGLFVRTLVNLDQINPGFAMDHLLLFRLTPGDAGYREPQTTAFFERVQQSLVEIPGVRSVALTQTPPLSGGSWQFGSAVPGRVSEPVNGLIVSEGFFATMAIPIVHGRDLRPSDDDRAPKVVVVNEAFVHQYLPDRDPVGLQLDSGGDTDWLIVGVCRDAAYVNLKAGAQPTVHFSFRQYPFRFGAKVILRTALPPLALTTAARQVVTAVDPNIPLTEISTEEQVRDESTSQERMFATLCGSLAVLALLLSWIGLYGLMAYHIARRTREIGIRMALGATRRQIAGSVLRQAMLLAVTGVGFGLPLTLVLTRLISSILYGVAPSDPVTPSGAVVLLLMVAAAAAWLPARRAAKVDPLVALRYE